MLALVNPILEEWFWRLFLAKTCDEKHKMIINVSYVLFHYGVLSCIMNWKLAIGFTTTFFSVASSFEYIKSKYGFLTCVITHIGMSLASTFCWMDVLFLEMSN